MKPLNLDNSPCSPISSNCVIWQGPNIPCIKLCTGDTISDVINALAKELCNIMDLLDVNGYDLSCFDLVGCKPQNIQELIQFLIDKICALESVDTAVAATAITRTTTASTADTLVTVAPCFVVGTTTVMTVTEYAIAIGNSICGLIIQINALNSQVTNLDIRVTALEAAPIPTFTLPSFPIGCNIDSLISGVTYDIDVILEEYINNVWCLYYATTGSSNDLINAISAQCIIGTDFTKVNPAATYNMQYPTFIDPATTVADILNNMWIILCDFYNSITVTVTGATTNTIETTVTGGPAFVVSAKILDTGWVDLEGFDFYTGAETDSFRPRVRRIGNTLHFKGRAMIPIDNAGVPLLWQYSTSPPIDTYYLSTTIAPATLGPGAVALSTTGLIQFNNGLGVIPTTVMGNFESLDDSYTKTDVIGFRRVQVDAAPVTSTILTTVGTISIADNRTLNIILLKNQEQNIFSGTAAWNTSHLNYVVSHVIAGDNVPDFANNNTNVNSNTGAGTIGLDLEYSATNVYPFSCNANDEQQVGGFIFILDGLMAYIDPCTTDIPTPIICP
jgi:hypothetical protein